MNINPINYANIPVQKMEFPDLLAEYFRPQQMRQKQQMGEEQLLTSQQGREMGVEKIAGQKLANQEQELVNALTQQFGVPEKQAKLALMQAQTNHQNRIGMGRPGGGGGGSGGGTGGGRGGLTTGWRMWQSLPANEKQTVIAKANAAGIPVDEFILALSQGKTIDQIISGRGQALQELNPQFSPTTSNITQMKQQEGSLAEIDVLENKINHGMSKYIETFNGYSPKQVADSLRGANKDEQARYLAARSMQPELASARSALAGGSNAGAVIHDMVDKSLGNSKIFQGLVTPEVYELSQKYVNQWLKEGVNARHKAIKGNSGNKAQGQTEALKSANPQGNTVRGTLNGKSFNIPASKAEEFKKAGGVISGY